MNFFFKGVGGSWLVVFNRRARSRKEGHIRLFFYLVGSVFFPCGRFGLLQRLVSGVGEGATLYMPMGDGLAQAINLGLGDANLSFLL